MPAVEATSRQAPPETSRLLIWLSRWRINVAALAAVPILLLAEPTLDSIAVCLPLLLVGVLIRIWARGHLERQTQVTWSGPYAYVRHPLYVGSFFMGLAFCGMTRLPAVPVLFAVVFIAMYWPKVIREERWMRQRFGPDYATYAASTGAVIPHLRWGAPALALPGATSFAWRRVRRHREWKTWVGVAALVGVLVLRTQL